MSRRRSARLYDLGALAEGIIVDAHGDDEPQVACLEMFNREAQLPAAATVLGVPVEVVGFDYQDGRYGIVAESRRDASHQAVVVVDLHFPPDSVTAWVQGPADAGSASSHIRTTFLLGGGLPGRVRAQGRGRIGRTLWSPDERVPVL